MAVRDDKGRFVKGHSGNPNGRGTRDRELRYYEIAMNTVTYSDWTAIINTAVKQAKRGDQQARKWLCDYLAPQAQRHELSGIDGEVIRVMLKDSEDD